MAHAFIRIFTLFLLSVVWSGPVLAAETGAPVAPKAPAAGSAAQPRGSQAPSPQAPKPDAGQTASPQAVFAAVLVEAEKADFLAMLRVGAFYENGYGVERNFGKALEWYKKSADGGLLEGIYNVGVCYEVGMGTAVNLDRAIVQYRLAAEKGLAQGSYKLSVMYFSGHGLPKDSVKGLEAMTKAADAGHPRALNDLAMIRLRGLFGVKPDGVEAMRRLIAASEVGSLDAMQNLIVVYAEGLAGQTQNPAKAYTWYLVCRRAGLPEHLLPQVGGVTAGLDDTGRKNAEKEAEIWIAAWEKRQAGQ